VWVIRGGSPPKGTPGCFRVVRGILVGAVGHQRRVKLTEDDPLSTFEPWSHKGDVGTWGKSAVRPQSGPRPRR
jgi:hypothetical protein